MHQDATERAASVLAEARWTGRTIEGLPDEVRPRSVEDGYRIQAAFRSLWKDKIAGWKIGATAKPVMAKFGISEPFIGPFYAGNVYPSPARPEARRFNQFVIETEFAYRLGHALSPRAAGYARAEIVDAVDAIVPAFELINCRYRSLPLDNAPAAIADCGLNGAMVLGTPILDWQGLDVPNQSVRLIVDGAVKGEGTGALALDDPRNVLDWAVNKLSRDGIGLEAGQILSTGTCTGVVALEPGQTAIGDFGTMGKVEVRFV